VEEVLVEDTAGYKKMLRMNCATFEKILTAILNEFDDFRGRELTRKLASLIMFEEAQS